MLGTPTTENWPQLESLPDYSKIKFPFEAGTDLGDFLDDTPTQTVNLIKQLLIYDFHKRLSARDCLKHPFFFSDPLPTPISELPLPPENPRRFRKI